jgi:triacylglycerol esterase/lipase EstA (alpha/beta hydrolase family)
MSIFCFANVAFASSSGSKIQQPQDKYAILLCHGMAANQKIFGLVDYFYNIPGWLESKDGEFIKPEIKSPNGTMPCIKGQN